MSITYFGTLKEQLNTSIEQLNNQVSQYGIHYELRLVSNSYRLVMVGATNPDLDTFVNDKQAQDKLRQSNEGLTFYNNRLNKSQGPGANVPDDSTSKRKYRR